MPHPLEPYLIDLRQNRAVATAETSGYPALTTMLNAVGNALRPKVRCVIHPRNRGAGLPDGGLFQLDQLRNVADSDALQVAPPARGVIEVKAVHEAVDVTAQTEQVARYLDEYGQLLVTNYREFLLLERDTAGGATEVERFAIANSAEVFWQRAAAPEATANEYGAPLFEFLQRVMRRPVPLREPSDVAWFLASYARDALRLIETRGELPALAAVRAALEQALGVDFEGERGEHFFRSTLIQTLFYGVFSAWVLWYRSGPSPGARFDWRRAEWELHVPVIRALFEQVAAPSQLRPLGLVPLLERAGEVLNRVDRPAFFERFRQEYAVQYFYEPFLEQFDPKLRKELGVWYTPPQVVRYMVARVDRVLRDELGVQDGLADERVIVLDPCCGTGTYLVEVLRKISETLHQRAGGQPDALAAQDLKRCAIGRVFGFELLPAPFVVAHLQLGILLQQQQAPLAEGERAGVFLTNALTGWHPVADPQQVIFPELAQERDAAAQVKREAPIIVILGNPPYNGFAGVRIGEERDLTTAYREVRRVARPQGQGLNDLYVRFFRMAERKIVEMPPGRGIVCFISNYSWLDGLSHPGMRERFLDEFDSITIDCLNGDKYKTGKLTPDGLPDPSIFSTQYNREGIQVGTAIATLVRYDPHEVSGRVKFRHFWGVDKLPRLDELANLNEMENYEDFAPALELNLMLRPYSEIHEGYLRWPSLPELFPASWPGIKTSRDPFVVDLDRQRLIARMTRYFSEDVTDADMAAEAPVAMQDATRFRAAETRRTLQRRGLLANNFRRYLYRPFDPRWLYWEPLTKLLDEKRSEYVPHVFPGNVWFVAAQQNRKQFDPPVITEHLSSLHVIERGANLYPLVLNEAAEALPFVDDRTPHDEAGHIYNASHDAVSYLQQLEVADPSDLFFHAVAIQHSPEYAKENDPALRQNWPRVPMPRNARTLHASATLGRQMSALLDPESAVRDVTTGAVRSELRPIAVISRVGGGQLAAEELSVNANWGFSGEDGAVMPAGGRIQEREHSPDERRAFAAGAAALGLDSELLGKTMIDVYLNEVAYWRAIPERVWTYALGGYQVLKKWLSYRELEILGRPLTRDEARYFSNVARRIAALLLLGPQLDANYRACAAHPVEWTSEQPSN